MPAMFNHRRFHFLTFVAEPFSLQPRGLSRSLVLLGWGPGAAAGRPESRVEEPCGRGGSSLVPPSPRQPWGQSPALGGPFWSGTEPDGCGELGALRRSRCLWSSTEPSTPLRTVSCGAGVHRRDCDVSQASGAPMRGFFFGGTPAAVKTGPPGLRLAGWGNLCQHS